MIRYLISYIKSLPKEYANDKILQWMSSFIEQMVNTLNTQSNS